MNNGGFSYRHKLARMVVLRFGNMRISSLSEIAVVFSGYRFFPSVLIVLCLGFQGCSESTPGHDDQDPDPILSKQILGVCFMGNEECLSTYVDLGEYEAKTDVSADSMIPVFIFPSRPDTDGGDINPHDPLGLYQPFRLQNNVFAGPGRVWSMFEVHSRNLLLKAEPIPGLVLWGKGVTPPDTTNDENPRPRVRDLYTNPIKSAVELVQLEQQGDVEIVDLFFATDCPLVVARPEDIVINLNPNFPVCD